MRTLAQKCLERNCVFLSEPFIFGPWTTTEFCTETCGGEGQLLEQRSCTPLHPDKSCASLSSDKTLRPGNKTCGEGQCEGNCKILHFFPSFIAITGTHTRWSDWSFCKAPDCENDPNHAVMTRTQTNVDDPTDVKTQEIPCQSPCPPGGTKEYNYDIV